jgi:hypothetical protein
MEGPDQHLTSADRLAGVRPAPWWLHVLLVGTYFGMIAMGTWVVPKDSWMPLFEQTYGLVHLIYLACLFLVCIVLLGVGRRRPAEVGLKLARLPAGAAYTFLVWTALQLVMLAWYWLSAKGVAIADEWSEQGWMRLGGVFIGHFFGNALYEEVVFRGFFLVQLALMFNARVPGRPRMAMAIAFVLSGGLFSLLHIPSRLLGSMYPSLAALGADQFELLVSACVYSWVYWRTGNLFFAVGLHGLTNHPTTVLAWRDIGPFAMPFPILLILGTIVALLWPSGRDSSAGGD